MATFPSTVSLPILLPTSTNGRLWSRRILSSNIQSVFKFPPHAHIDSIWLVRKALQICRFLLPFSFFSCKTSFGEDTRSVFPIVSHILDYAGDMFKACSSVQGISCNLIVRWIEQDVWFWVRSQVILNHEEDLLPPGLALCDVSGHWSSLPRSIRSEGLHENGWF